jgi:hypothetical protein
MAHGADEWNELDSDLPSPVLKIDDLKVFECPISLVTPWSWQMLRMVNLTTNAAGDILREPYPERGGIRMQPPWYHEAVDMVRSERNSSWFRQLQREQATTA